MCFRVCRVNEFDADFVDFVLELSWPVQIFTVRLDKQDLCLENAYIVHSFSVVIRQIDDLVIEILIVLVSLYNTYSFIDVYIRLSKEISSFLLDSGLYFLHI